MNFVNDEDLIERIYEILNHFSFSDISKYTSGIRGVKSEVDSIKNASEKDTVSFGRLNWIVAEKQKDQALLISSTIVTKKSLQDNLYNWLNTDFFLHAFSHDEREFLLEFKNNFKVFLPTSGMAGYLTIKQRSRGFDWWLEKAGRGAYMSEGGYPFYTDRLNEVKGVVPAIIVRLV